MGVLNCNRNGCENIMCDRYSDIYGYICFDCFNELINQGPEMSINLFMESISSVNGRKEESIARYNAAFS